ncbi:hypothetical protein M0812_27979 [Anaeramoeba flamelloides]|uniref:Uncharacterized protein n=1 Tax=Anaeramoeba flamelloides TaxID=1746091 RepID=A0AAV7Y7P7_9EUKA|nr:hypothetical protein M0812_27979 [Anaeramoeba flamelloides]
MSELKSRLLTESDKFSSGEESHTSEGDSNTLPLVPAYDLPKSNEEPVFSLTKRHGKKKWRIPIILDLVAENSRFRLFTIVIFLVVLLNATSVLNSFFSADLTYADDLPAKITFSSYPPFNQDYSKELSSSPVLRISSRSDIGSPNKQVEFIPVYYSAKNKFINGFDLEEYRYKDVTKIIIDGIKQENNGSVIQKSDADGFVKFKNLKISGGPVGIVLFNFLVTDSLNTYLPVYTFSKVNKIENKTAPPTSVTGHTDDQFFGQPLSVQPKFQIFDLDGNPSPGHYVTIFDYKCQPFNYPYRNRMSILENNVAGPSDSNGYVEFKDLTIIGGTTDYQFLSAFCEDDLNLSLGTPWVDYRDGQLENTNFIEPIKLKTQVSQVLIIEQPSSKIKEGQSFATQPKIRITDSNDEPLPGKVVIAKLIVSGNDDISPLKTPNDLKTKHLLNVVSGKTNSKGEVRFGNLRFSYKGLTVHNWQNFEFKIEFICDGVHSDPSDPVYIDSIVSHIEIISQPTQIEPLNAWLLSPKQNQSTPTGLISPDIVVRVLDQNGVGIPRKLVILYAQSNLYKGDYHDQSVRFSKYIDSTDLDGIITFPFTQISSVNDSSINEIDFYFYIDGYDFKINEKPVPVEVINQPNMTRCSQIWVDRTNIPQYLVDPKYKVGTAPFNITVRVMDYQGKGMPGMKVLTGNVISSANEFPVNYFSPIEAQDLTDEDGFTVLENAQWFGYNSTMELFFAAYNPDLTPQLYSSKLPYDCYSTFSIQLQQAITKIETTKFPNNDQKHYPYQVLNDLIQIKLINEQYENLYGDDNDYEDEEELEYDQKTLYEQNLSGFYSEMLPISFPLYLFFFEDFEMYGPKKNLISSENQLVTYNWFDLYKTTNMSNAEGIINFNDLYFIYPGTYMVSFRSAGILNTENHEIIISCEVTELEIIQQPQYKDGKEPIYADIVLDQQPILRLLDNNGQPVVGYRAFAQSTDNSIIIYKNSLGVGGVVSDFSNATGYVHFSGIKFAGIDEEDNYTITFRVFASNTQNDDLDPTIISQPIPATTNVGKLYVSSLPKSSGPGQLFNSCPILSATLSNGNVAKERYVGINVLQTPTKSDQTINDIFYGWYEKTDSSGRVYFSNLKFLATAKVGYYQINFQMDNVTSDSYWIELTNDPDNIEIAIQPNTNVTIGEPFFRTQETFTFRNETIIGRLSVKVTERSGSPLQNIVTHATIGTAPENFVKKTSMLDQSRTTSITNENGIAQFELKLLAGAEGYYTIIFQAGTIFSTETDKIYVKNNIDQVKITTQPANQKATATTEDSKLDLRSKMGTKIYQQPQIQLLSRNDNNQKITGKTVVARSSKGNEMRNYVAITDEDGIAHFTDLMFFNGDTGDYQIIFNCEGIDSEPSDTIAVINTNSPNLSEIPDLQSLIISALVLSIIPFWSNSFRQKGKYLMIFSFIICSLYLSLALLVIYTVKSWINNPFLTFINIISIIILFLPLIFIILIILLKSKYIKKRLNILFPKTRLNNWINLAQRLIPIGSIKKQQIGFIKKKLGLTKNNFYLLNIQNDKGSEKNFYQNENNEFINENEIEEEKENEKENEKEKEKEKEKGKEKKEIKQLWKSIDEFNNEEIIEFSKSVLNLKNNNEIDSITHNNESDEDNNEINKGEDTLASSDIELKNIPKKTKKEKIFIKLNQAKNIIKNIKKKTQKRNENRHIPYELSTDYYHPLRLWLSFFLSVIFAIFITLLLLKLIYYFIFKIKVWRQALLEYQTSFSGYTNLISDSFDTSDNSVIMTNVEAFLGSSLPKSSTQFLPDTLLSALTFLENFDENTIVQFENVMINSTIITATISFLIMVVIWFLIFKKYKNRIYLLRQGINPFNFPFDNAKIQFATHYIGIQGWLSSIGFIFSWVVVLIITFIIIFKPIRDYLLKYLYTLLIGMIGSLIIKQVVKLIIKKYFIKNGRVKERRWFGLFDIIWIVINLATSITTAIIRIVTVIALYLVTFIRTDLAPVSRFVHQFDSGFKAYLGMMKLDHQTNNPVLNVFVHFILKSFLKRQKNDNTNIDLGENIKSLKTKIHLNNISFQIQVDNETELLKRKRALSKWWLYSSLLNNPKLEKRRSKNLSKKNKKKIKKKKPLEKEKLDESLLSPLSSFSSEYSDTDETNPQNINKH